MATSLLHVASAIALDHKEGGHPYLHHVMTMSQWLPL